MLRKVLKVITKNMTGVLMCVAGLGLTVSGVYGLILGIFNGGYVLLFMGIGLLFIGFVLLAGEKIQYFIDRFF